MKKILALLCIFFISLSAFGQTLYIFGGKDHDEYLGKFNASPYDSESIWNKYGEYGSKYQTNSIWNKYGTYGGRYSQYSPFNSYASYPPVLVDKDGKFYGYFSANSYKTRSYAKTIAFICKHWEDILENPSEWYDDLF